MVTGDICWGNRKHAGIAGLWTALLLATTTGLAVAQENSDGGVERQTHPLVVDRSRPIPAIASCYTADAGCFYGERLDVIATLTYRW
jgi:hypothetical protein